MSESKIVMRLEEILRPAAPVVGVVGSDVRDFGVLPARSSAASEASEDCLSTGDAPKSRR